MSPKDYLNRYKELDEEINDLCEELTHWRAIATKITPPDKYTGGSTSPADKVGLAVEKIIDLEDKINKKIDELVDMREDILRTIYTVDDATLQLILTRRYILCKRWEDIAADLGMDLRWIYRLHGKALQKIKIDH